MDYKQVNDYEVIYMIKENDEEARNLLIRKYKPIINKISNKYISSVKPFGVNGTAAYRTAEKRSGCRDH